MTRSFSQGKLGMSKHRYIRSIVMFWITKNYLLRLSVKVHVKLVIY